MAYQSSFESRQAAVQAIIGDNNDNRIYSHQREAVKAIGEKFQEFDFNRDTHSIEDIALVVLPTGTGKV